mmetsp:Transcript_25572/g.42846  ORF Transcript_25572/g.42846 Transcript_25572/m.42846 type:complete len:291 (-) Transcript_25572:235-1107(-)
MVTTKRMLPSEKVIDLTHDASSSQVATSGKEVNRMGVVTTGDLSPGDVIDLTNEVSSSSSTTTSSSSSNSTASQREAVHQLSKKSKVFGQIPKKMMIKASKRPKSHLTLPSSESIKNSSKLDGNNFREMNMVKKRIMRKQQRLWPNCPIELYDTGDLQLGHGIRSKGEIDPGTFVASYPSIVKKCYFNSKFAATYQVSLDKKKKLCHSPDIDAMKKMKTDKVPVIGTIVPPLAVFVNGSKSKEDANSVLYQLSGYIRSRVGSRNTMFLKVVKKVQPGEEIRWYYGEDYNF